MQFRKCASRALEAFRCPPLPHRTVCTSLLSMLFGGLLCVLPRWEATAWGWNSQSPFSLDSNKSGLKVSCWPDASALTMKLSPEVCVIQAGSWCWLISAGKEFGARVPSCSQMTSKTGECRPRAGSGTQECAVHCHHNVGSTQKPINQPMVEQNVFS